MDDRGRSTWWTELRELTRVRVMLFLREPEAIFWVFVFPLVLAGVLGFAFRSGGIDPSPIIVVGGAEAEALVATLETEEHLDVQRADDRDSALGQLKRAKVDAVVEPGDPLRLTFDPTRSEASTAELRIERALARAEYPDAAPRLERDPVTETGSRYVDFLFPGLLGMNLMGTGMWGVGFAVADIRRRKLLKRLMVTPMRRSSFFLSFNLSRLVFLVLELTVLVSFGYFLLGVPMRGDLVSFGAVCLLGAFLFAGLGILVASRARTIQGVSGLMNLVMMPMWLASGVFFSYERFPEAIHPVLKLLPLTALNDALRAVMLEGASVVSLGSELAIMTVWGAGCLLVALKIFRWE